MSSGVGYLLWSELSSSAFSARNTRLAAMAAGMVITEDELMIGKGRLSRHIQEGSTGSVFKSASMAQWWLIRRIKKKRI